MEEYQENKKVKPKKSRVYTTEIIKNLFDDLSMGIEIDNTPFYPFDNELRAANVTFKMSGEEYEEYMKCYNDAEYFIENYCKFVTDHGRMTVKLRDYQKEIVSAVTSQHYDEGIEEFVPDNRNVIMMCARQMGKCLLPDSKIQGKNGTKKIYMSKGWRKVVNLLKRCLIKIYNKI